MSQAVEQLSLIESALNDGIADLKKWEEKIHDINERCMTLKVSGPDDDEGYRECKSARGDVVTLRTSIEKRRKALKAPVLNYGRDLDAVAKTLTSMLESSENYLRSQEAIVDDEKKRIEAEKLAAEKAKLDSRVASLAEYGESMPIDELRALPDWKFDAMVSNAKAAKKEREKLQAEENERRRIEAERLESQRKELDAQRAELDRQRKELEAKTVVDEPIVTAEIETPSIMSQPVAATVADVDMAEIRRQFVKIKWKLHDIVDKDLPDFKRVEAAEILNVAARSLIDLIG